MLPVTAGDLSRHLAGNRGFTRVPSPKRHSIKGGGAIGQSGVVRSMTNKVARPILIASAFMTYPLADTQARIICDGNFQVVNGQPIATPYCRELNLARVARGYG